VTTALEETWGTAEHLVFLGDWCKPYERRHVWSQRDHETVPFHWDDRQKLKDDYDRLESLHHSLLGHVASALNAWHQVNHSVRYWQVLVDPWLLAYLGVVFDRWESLHVAFEQHGQLETIAFDETVPKSPPFSYAEFLTEALSDRWNHSLCQRIIEYRYGAECRMRAGIPPATALMPRAPLATPSLLGRVLLAADRVLGKCVSKYEIVFLNSYFRPLPLLRLNLALGQVPRLFATDFDLDARLVGFSSGAANRTDRSALNLEFEPKTRFEEFIRQSIVGDVPYCLVEGYRALRERAKAASIRTKAIVTAQFHWTNAYAKAWMAEQVDNGVKLAIVEHGGSLATYKTAFDFEEDIADVKCTWFLPHHPKHVQLPPSRQIGRSGNAAPTDAGERRYCALVGGEQPRWVTRAHFYPMAAQCLVAFDMSLGLYALLDDEIKNAFRVRPYPDVGWNTKQRYADSLGRDRVLSDGPIDRFFASARIIVCTYPETTFSDAMATVVPTVQVYPADLNELHPAALPLLNMLTAAGIVYHEPAAAARHLNAIWAEPERWWNSSHVTRARAEFCRQALNLSPDWLQQWTSFLNDLTA
jgi:putative transferase (TIGR04331 family)